MTGVCSRVLVTGGAGFIGSYVVERLLGEGYEVVVLDSLERGNFENIGDHIDKKSFLFVRGDIRDPQLVKEIVKEAGSIIHLAALTSVPESFEKPSLYLDVNVAGTLNLLSACLGSNVRRFVFASSCAVYGDPEKVPIEENSPLAPMSPYSVSKIAAEAYARLFFKEHGLETVSLRYFNVYGPRQAHSQYSGVITQFIDCMKHNRALTIFGDGRQRRDFVHVKDVVEANILALTKDNIAGEVFNIGTGKATTINELANMMLETGEKTNLRVIHRKPRKGEIRHSIATITKAKEEMGYFPKVSLRTGLHGLVRDHQEYA